ncbi:hypothetical protein Ct9H90mP29_21780 [bacterium]|nr:MAG: hypothetical protein Ct9H90mP29_21780 [bacterium]
MGGIKDSLTSINFKTSDYQGFGNLIINTISEGERNIVAKLEKMEKPYYTFRSVVNLEGQTVLDKIPEGNYSLTFFQEVIITCNILMVLLTLINLQSGFIIFRILLKSDLIGILSCKK